MSSAQDIEDLNDIFCDFSGDDEIDVQHEQRNTRWEHQRVNWKQHATQLVHENRFEREYLMSIDAWNKLYVILHPKLQRMKSKSRSPEPIVDELIIGIGLRYLAGGRVANDRHIFGMSYAQAYHSINDFISAVLTSPELTISFPQTSEQWEEVRRGFANKSKHNVFVGCVGAVDGFLQKTIAPSSTDASNIRSYYSGHYESYGVNCQAACDSTLKFLYFGVVASGSTNDNIAYAMATELRDTIEALPLGLYFVGDAAYTLSERLLIPFTGSQRENLNNDAFNFHLSQLRIRIEMAFGRLVIKFRILKKNLECSLQKNVRVIMTCARLHNHIIEHDTQEWNENNEINIDDIGISAMPGAPMNMCYNPTMIEDSFHEIVGTSQTRVAIVNFIENSFIRRPIYNIQRNNALSLDLDNSREFYHPN